MFTLLPLALSGWVLYGGGAVGDLGSTEIALHRGARESNPLGQSVGARIALKAAATPLLVWGDGKMPKKVRVIFRVTYVIGMGYVIYHNLSLSRRRP